MYLTGDAALAILLDDHSILGHLLLDEDDLLDAADDEVAAAVVGTLVHLGHLGGRAAGQGAVGAAQHDRHAADGQPVADHALIAARVLDVHGDRRRVRHVAQPALVGRRRPGLQPPTNPTSRLEFSSFS